MVKVIKQLVKPIAQPKLNQPKSIQPGISLVELLIATTVLATAAVGVFQLMSRSETQLFESRNALTTQQVEEAIGSYVYDDFLDNSLSDNSSAQPFDTSALPADLQEKGLQIATIFGTQDRYDDDSTLAKCRLDTSTDETIGTITFPADCVITPPNNTDNATIAQNINAVLNEGARIAFAVHNAGGRCTASQPMDTSTIGYGQTATLRVDDPNCLNSPNAGQPAADSEIIFPRFVAYSTEEPGRYYTSLVENSVAESRGMKLTAPDNITVKSGLPRTISNLVLTALADNDSGVINISTGINGAFINITNASGAQVSGDNSTNVTLTGTFKQLKSAIRTTTYRSALGYFGDDNISIAARSGPIAVSDFIEVVVTPNCGDQTEGTATRFDLGYMDNSSGTAVFDNDSMTFYTSVSVFDNSSPTHYYGFCRQGGSGYRYDYATQTKPSNSTCTYPYRHASTRLQEEAVSRAITTILYEEADQNGKDRYALVFVFDRVPGICNDSPGPAGANAAAKLPNARSSGQGLTDAEALSLGWQGSTSSGRRCHLTFRLSNIEPGRDLDDETDLHTFTDDSGEYDGGSGSVIDSDGVLVANAHWQSPTDGVVVPLGIDNATLTPRELNQYAYGNPIFELVWWDTLDKWNIRSLITDNNTVGFRQVNFAPGNSFQNQAIRLNIEQSQRCPTS